MFQRLVSRNDDIRRLAEKGYAVAFDNEHYLIVRDIPYLDAKGDLHIGAIVSKFKDMGQDLIAQHDHQILFAGGVPHGLDGRPIPLLGGGPASLTLSDGSADVVVERSFSNKPQPAGSFPDFFEKIESYVRIISGPAMSRHAATPLTFRMVGETPSYSPFKLRDTLTSLAEIGDLSRKFRDDSIAIIGLGGTGAYVLDFLAKTPVREIRGFDSDLFHVHNAFRSPGRFDESELGTPKSELYRARYDSFRTGLTLNRKFIDASCADDFRGVTFAFVCVDKGTARAGIFELLLSLGIPFIDVGMGLSRKDGTLDGMMRATYYSEENGRSTRDARLAELVDDPQDVYRTTVQIAELNALNAGLAVVMYKQLRGFYGQDEPYYHSLWRIGGLRINSNAQARQN